MVEIYAMIREAIFNRDIIVASYHGYVREMCPHVIGKKNIALSICGRKQQSPAA
jgi:hypothetical protein